MLEEIRYKYTQRLTLTTLATTLRRQSAYLGRLFREEIGVTVHEYITRARMMFGASQVRSGVKIEAVALDLGYRSKKNFYRQFKRRFGMTPEAYRTYHAGEDNAPVREAKRLRRERSSARARALGPASFARQMLRALLGQRIGILATDDVGRCVAANEATVSVTGYSIDELRGMPSQMLFPSQIRADAGSRLQLLLPVSPFLPPNAVLRTKSAHWVHIHITSAENLLGISTTGGGAPQESL